MAIAVKWVKSAGAVNVAGVSITRVAGTNDVAAGDVLVAIYKQRGGTADTDITPTGWTRTPQSLIGTVSGQYRNMYHKVITDATAAAAEPTSYTFNYNPGSGSASQVAMVLCLTGVDTSIIQNGVAWPSTLMPTPNVGTGGSTLTHPAITFPSTADWFLFRGLLYTGNANAINPTWDPALSVVAVRNFGATSEVIGLASEQLTAAASTGTRTTVAQDASLANHTVNPWLASTWAVPATPTDPVLNTAPQVTGAGITGSNAIRGIILNGTNGSWQNATTFVPQWQRSTDSTGATFNDIALNANGLNYTPVAADQGLKVRLKITATGASGVPVAGFSSAYLVVPPAPQAVAPGPTITGSPRPSNQLTLSTGAWTEQVDTISIHWHASTGGAPVDIPGAVGSTYLVQNGDVGSIIGARVVATNVSGSSSPAESNTVTIIPGFSSANIEVGLTGGASNADQFSSFGGVRSTAVTQIQATTNALLPDITSDEARLGYTDYVAVAVHNSSSTSTWASVVAYVDGLTSSTDDEIALAIDPAGISTPGSIISSRTVAPRTSAGALLTFSTPTTKPAGLSIGSLAPDDYRIVWIRRTVTPGAARSSPDTASVRFEGNGPDGAVGYSFPIIYGINPPRQMGFPYHDRTAGLVGTIGMLVKNVDTGEIVIPWSTGGISEDFPGHYIATRNAVVDLGNYEVYWSSAYPLTAVSFQVGTFEVKDMIQQALDLTVEQIQSGVLGAAVADYAPTPGSLAELLSSRLDAPVSSSATVNDIIRSLIALG